jgi:FKBP-type peptidyl-prolyl cis-trans isomerase FklB
MHRSLLTLVLVLAPLSLAPAQENLPPSQGMSTLKQKASYGIGLNIGRSLKADNLDVDAKLIAAGIADALSGAEPKLNPQEFQQVMQAFQAEMEKRMETERATAGTTNKQKGAEFLAANAKAPGIKTLPSGIQYKEIKAGDGPMPKETDTVRVHYEGTLIDGTVFDSSYERGQPATFPLNRVIKGWTLAVQQMNVGDTWMIYVPSELAYGETGAGGDIGPHETLIFKIELLGIDQ